MLLTTYGMVLHNADDLGAAPRHSGLQASDGKDDNDGNPGWDVIFMDEVSGARLCLLSRSCMPPFLYQ